MEMSKDAEHLSRALELGKLCTPTRTAYCVGCVIVTENGSTVVSTGYSRQLPGNTHAEQCAIDGIPDQISENLVMYTTMEPCSERLSGNLPCADKIISHGNIVRVMVGIREPDTFVTCFGIRRLMDAGVQVDFSTDKKFEAECMKVATRGH